MKNRIYELKLHEECQLGYGLKVLRVPGGWLYTQYEQTNGVNKNTTTTFVPFNNEFQKNA